MDSWKMLSPARSYAVFSRFIPNAELRPGWYLFLLCTPSLGVMSREVVIRLSRHAIVPSLKSVLSAPDKLVITTLLGVMVLVLVLDN